MLLKRTKQLVYQLPIKWRSDQVNIGMLEYTPINVEVIKSMFKDDKARRATFAKFLRKGFFGIVWHNKCEWLSYAWISLPVTLGPPHLPRAVQELPVYWIFYCRTKEGFQGKGLFNASLCTLSSWARERDPEAEIYIDTSPDNAPSRAAIEKAGFVPKGIITTLAFRIPKYSRIIGGHWDQSAKHPEVNK